jgi:Archaeal/vacuolar-type H+-ATPase subunit E
MTGLEKMKSQILDEARAAAEKKLSAARSEADGILAEAKAEAEKCMSSFSQKSERAVASYKERVASSNDLQRRTKILAAKQEMIAAVLDKAYRSVESMEKDEYFGMLLKMLDKYAQPQEGEIFFSPADLAKLPDGFAGKVEEAAKKKGGSLKISKEGRNIENGFILAYGGIEENCTLRAMFDAKRDELSDKVYRILFL